MATLLAVRWCTKSGSTVYCEEIANPRLKKAMSPPKATKFHQAGTDPTRHLPAGAAASLLTRNAVPQLADPTGGKPALFQVLLVVLLGPVEHLGRDNLRHDWPSIPARTLQLLLGRGGCCLLLRRVVEDD
jgi:hypothetical protein